MAGEMRCTVCECVMFELSDAVVYFQGKVVSVRPSVGRSVPNYFPTNNMVDFESEKSATDIIIHK